MSGGAFGVDNVGVAAAIDNKLAFLIFRPDWDKYGGGAGFIRNATIVENSDRLVAFWDCKSNGTRDSIRKAMKKGIPVEVYGPDGDLLSAETVLRLIA